MNSFAQFLPTLLQRIPEKPELLESLVFAFWTKAVGEELGKRTRLLNFQRGRLTVAVPSAGWKRELLSDQAEILLHLDKQFGRRVVKSLAFKIDSSLEKGDTDETSSRLPKTGLDNRKPRNNSLEAEIKEGGGKSMGEASNRMVPELSLTGIDDLELRKALASAANQYLTRKAPALLIKVQTSGR
jgi:hypothetical protein